MKLVTGINIVVNKLSGTKTIKIDNSSVGERLDKFLIGFFPDLSRTLVQRLIKEGFVLVNSNQTKSGHKLKENELVFVSLPELKEPEIEAEDIALDVVYEDNEVVVINKPQGMVTHPASGHYKGTLVNALLKHCRGSLSGINGVLRPGIVHRLDKETSGLILVCKNDFSHNFIAKQIKDRTVSRNYLAIVYGLMKYDKGVINKPIGRHKAQRHKMAVVSDGREAITRWKILKRFDKYTFVELSLETGRTHQIRVHLSNIGYPVVGDKTYGKKNDSSNLMMLHAYKLSFIHPKNEKKVTLETQVPERMLSFMKMYDS